MKQDYFFRWLFLCFLIPSLGIHAQGCNPDTLQNCSCNFEPTSLFANPSFEEHNGCELGDFATSPSQILPGWLDIWGPELDYEYVQYINPQCPIIFSGLPKVPLPLPAGDAFVSIFMSGGGGSLTEKTTPKGYVGAYPLQPLLKGVQYTLTFYLGFGVPAYPDVNIAIFGTPNPLDVMNEDSSFGCPLNLHQSWQMLGSVPVHGFDQWVKARIDFVPDTNMVVLAVGEDCGGLPWPTDSYYIDDLVLSPTDSFHFRQAEVLNGDPCRGYTLGVQGGWAASAQWYKDSILIPGATGSTYQVPQDPVASGWYNVKLTDGVSCTISSPVRVRISGADGIDLGDDTVMCLHNKLLEHISPEGFNMTWQDGSTDSAYVISQAGLYTLTARDSSGCIINKSIQVSYHDCGNCDVYLPNAFSPNGDGKNDIFRARLLCTTVAHFRMQIFNAWGQKVFSSSDFNSGWDGNFHGQPAPMGTYVYFVSYDLLSGKVLIPESKKGAVLLIR